MHLSDIAFTLFLCCVAELTLAQNHLWEVPGGVAEKIEGENVVSWCTVSLAEQYKCGNLSAAIELDRGLFGGDYLPLNCERAFDTEECMTWVDSGKATLLALDAGEVFFAGRYHSLVPILQTVHEHNAAYEYAVAVTKPGALSGVQAGEGLAGLRGASACFPSVGTMAGWTLPVHTLMEEAGLKILDCNNHVKSAAEFFGESCAVNSLNDAFNPVGDNSDKLCRLCAGRAGTRCTEADPYGGYAGALRCLLEKGEVAFLRQTTVLRALESPALFGGLTDQTFELLCKDGSRKPVRDWKHCNWGKLPSDAIVTSSARTLTQKQRYQKYVMKILELYGEPSQANSTYNIQPDNSDPYAPYDPYTSTTSRQPFDNNRLSPGAVPFGRRIENFRLSDSARHGGTDLLLQDATSNVTTLQEEQQVALYVLRAAGPRAERAALGVRACPVKRAVVCLTSDPEMDKCVKMRTALKSAFLSPVLVCYRGHSTRLCERAVAEGVADFLLLDAADMLHAAQHHRLVPFMQEVYSSGQTWYYAVAVAKEQDPDTDLTYLRGKNTCHAGIGTAAGWVFPLAYLVSNGWLRPYGCDGARAASEYFSKSCAPGALSSEYVDPAQGAPRDNLCHLCHGVSFRRCRRDAGEDYFGHVGALRCMVEGGGDVAFVRHTAPQEVSGGRRREWWARDLLLDDLQLLCPDGTRAHPTEFAKCNLGRVPGSVLVGRANHTELDAYSGLMLYAQQLYGADRADDFSFSMFKSAPPYDDLIFSSAAVALRPLRHAERSAALVAGRTLPRAARVVACDAPHMSALQADPDFLSSASREDPGVLMAFLAVAAAALAAFTFHAK